MKFDHTAEGLEGPAFWDALRELRRNGAMVWIDDFGGYWAAMGYDALREVAQDYHTFVSGLGNTLNRPTPEMQPYVMPIEVDPPRQRLFRTNVNPQLAPKSVAPLEDEIRATADELIDAFIDRGSCDVVEEFAKIFPGMVFFRTMVGETDAALAQIEPLARALSFAQDKETRAESARLMRDWAAELLSRPRDEVPEIVRAVMRLDDSEVEEFADHELHSGLMLLAQGGIGTSSHLIGATVNFLCQDLALQERVRDDLSLVPALVEETLRLEPPVVMLFRTAVADTEVAGAQIEKGQMVGLFYGAANRDPTVFEDPDSFDLDRTTSPHVAFGLGVHRCIGSNLARLQVRVAIEQLITRLSPFRIPDGGRVRYVTSFQRGPSSIPLEFSPSHLVVQ